MDELNPQYLLDWACDLGQTNPFWDFHIHPYNVLSADTQFYHPDPTVPGVYSQTSAPYHPPSLAGHSAGKPPDEDEKETHLSDRSFLLLSRITYARVGPRVIADQLDLCGIRRALLLQVARQPGDSERLMAAAGQMFPQGEQFHFSCAMPVGMPADKLDDFYRSARAQWGISAIKIHTNLAGLDPTCPAGRAAIEATLVSAGRLGLPVVVHGGPSLGVEASVAGLGRLEHLREINWGLSAAPVIMAHAGLYHLSDDEARATLSIMRAMFDRHPNLFVDTSSLTLSSITRLLTHLDRARLIFGSDALYKPVWEIWVRFLHALRETSPHPDLDLVQIASFNPRHCLGLN
ncbi:MAG: amidohydrolase family protein [Anaerolineales bacterium]